MPRKLSLWPEIDSTKSLVHKWPKWITGQFMAISPDGARYNESSKAQQVLDPETEVEVLVMAYHSYVQVQFLWAISGWIVGFRGSLRFSFGSPKLLGLCANRG